MITGSSGSIWGNGTITLMTIDVAADATRSFNLPLPKGGSNDLSGCVSGK